MKQDSWRFLENKHFESSTQTWKRIFSLPGHRVTWRRIRAVFAPEFVGFMDRTMGEVRAIQPVDDFQAWKADLLIFRVIRTEGTAF